MNKLSTDSKIELLKNELINLKTRLIDMFYFHVSVFIEQPDRTLEEVVALFNSTALESYLSNVNDISDAISLVKGNIDLVKTDEDSVKRILATIFSNEVVIEIPPISKSDLQALVESDEDVQNTLISVLGVQSQIDNLNNEVGTVIPSVIQSAVDSIDIDSKFQEFFQSNPQYVQNITTNTIVAGVDEQKAEEIATDLISSLGILDNINSVQQSAITKTDQSEFDQFKSDITQLVSGLASVVETIEETQENSNVDVIEDINLIKSDLQSLQNSVNTLAADTTAQTLSTEVGSIQQKIVDLENLNTQISDSIQDLSSSLDMYLTEEEIRSSFLPMSTFEAISKNILSYPFDNMVTDGLNYTESRTYFLPEGGEIHKNEQLDENGRVISITLSGDTPEGKEYVKNLIRDESGVVQSVDYIINDVTN